MEAHNPAKIDKSLLSGGLEGERFEDFLRTFFYEELAREEMCSTEEVCRRIFEKEEWYSRFLLYCLENDFSFLEIDTDKNPHYKKAAMLLKFEEVSRELQGQVVENVSDILGVWNKDVVLSVANATVPGTDIQYLPAQLLAQQKGVPINSRGEVLYYLGSTKNYMRVYSHKSGEHLVDAEGMVFTRYEENRRQRREVLQKIYKYERFLSLIGVDQIVSDEDMQLAKEVLGKFARQENIVWTQLQEDDAQMRLYTLRLRSKISHRLWELRAEFAALQASDTSAQELLTLIAS